jgi:hypothetical protein
MQGLRVGFGRSLSPLKPNLKLHPGTHGSGSATPTSHLIQVAQTSSTAHRSDSLDLDNGTEEIILTGDDLVVEYVARLVYALRDRHELP